MTAQELVRQGLLLPSQKVRLRAAICELRKHLGSAAACIRSVRGFGYLYEQCDETATSSAIASPGTGVSSVNELSFLPDSRSEAGRGVSFEPWMVATR